MAGKNIEWIFDTRKPPVEQVEGLLAALAKIIGTDVEGLKERLDTATGPGLDSSLSSIQACNLDPDDPIAARTAMYAFFVLMGIGTYLYSEGTQQCKHGLKTVDCFLCTDTNKTEVVFN